AIDSTNWIYTLVEESARFPGGLDSWGSYLLENLQYPATAKKLGIEGRVFVQFIVEKDGSISDAKVVKGIGGGCDIEAQRVIQETPNWIPGRNRGKLVRQKMIQMVAFNLRKLEKEKRRSKKINN
ncbi:MAG: energy transducer TonB, partial [Bacteroidota bacterium]